MGGCLLAKKNLLECPVFFGNFKLYREFQWNVGLLMRAEATDTGAGIDKRLGKAYR